MCCNLLVGPAPGRQHGHRKFGGGQIVGRLVAGFGIVNPPPAPGEPVGNGDDPSELLRPLPLDDGLQHPAHQPYAGEGSAAGRDVEAAKALLEEAGGIKTAIVMHEARCPREAAQRALERPMDLWRAPSRLWRVHSDIGRNCVAQSCEM